MTVLLQTVTKALDLNPDNVDAYKYRGSGLPDQRRDLTVLLQTLPKR